MFSTCVHKRGTFGMEVFVFMLVHANENTIDKYSKLFMISLWNHMFIRACMVTPIPLMWIGEKP